MGIKSISYKRQMSGRRRPHALQTDMDALFGAGATAHLLELARCEVPGAADPEPESVPGAYTDVAAPA